MRAILIFVISLSCLNLTAQEIDSVILANYEYYSGAKDYYIKHEVETLNGENLKICGSTDCIISQYRESSKEFKKLSNHEIFEMIRRQPTIKFKQGKKSLLNCGFGYTTKDLENFRESQFFEVEIKYLLFQIYLAERRENNSRDSIYVEFVLNWPYGMNYPSTGLLVSSLKFENRNIFADILYEEGLITSLIPEFQKLVIEDPLKFKEVYSGVEFETNVEYWLKVWEELGK